MMKVKVRLFGVFRSFVKEGQSTLEMEVKEGASADEFRHALKRELFELNPESKKEEALLWDSALADGVTVLNETSVISPGSTIAVLPPVCGG